MKAGALVVVAAVLAIALGGCGGGGSSRLSKSDYEQQLRSQAKELRSAFDSLGKKTSLGNLAASVPKLQRKLDDAAAAIDKLKPPKDAEADNGKIAAALHRFADLFGKLGDAAKKRDATKLLDLQQQLRAAAAPAIAATNDLKAKGYAVGGFGG